ncbi:hypothetical protein SAMN04489724_1999 [Algoriphagus locisalis]|uniref:TolB-like 6-blade propeller-like n=1 Tax=Algoriphagus locisalis TaxID=305507 RepID=A0A1I7AIR2_9BACT|nr:hypothetical protein [Algoriphagus locisalis]SFT74827.1 hypothetical protein SAMN04489724_1999 [Algoriphagus locisalis]
MKRFTLALICIISINACSSPENGGSPPDLAELVIVDSIRVNENNFYLNGQGQIKIVGESLIAVSSIRKPAIGLIDLKTGNQIAQISASEFPEASFFPSSFDIVDFPVLYIADRYSNSIYEFNILEKKFIRRIKLQIPSEKVIKIALGEFHKTSSGFLVELTTGKVDTMHPDYYRNAGNLIYSFNSNGDSIGSFLKYPEIFTSQNGTINSQTYLKSTHFNNSFLYSFPQEGKIKRIKDKAPFSVIEEMDIPEALYFDQTLKGLDRIVTFDDFQNGENIQFPNNHYFNSILENETQIILETWMMNSEKPSNPRTSNLLIYDKAEETWYETSNPRNILDIGMLAGVVNDTLYFYEGSLMKSDEKYIKRAVLKPID